MSTNMTFRELRRSSKNMTAEQAYRLYRQLFSKALASERWPRSKSYYNSVGRAEVLLTKLAGIGNGHEWPEAGDMAETVLDVEIFSAREASVSMSHICKMFVSIADRPVFVGDGTTAAAQGWDAWRPVTLFLEWFSLKDGGVDTTISDEGLAVVERYMEAEGVFEGE